jgi:hypothetical protein
MDSSLQAKKKKVAIVHYIYQNKAEEHIFVLTFNSAFLLFILRF